ncbi:hypothetical protein V2G26_017335 [Clonostachys chloroleuca]
MDALITLWRSADGTTRGLGIAGLGQGSFKAADRGTATRARATDITNRRAERIGHRGEPAELISRHHPSNRKVEGVIAPTNPCPLSDDESEITSRNNLTRLSAAREEKFAC